MAYYLITDGEYSDYHVVALVEGPEDADLAQMQRTWAANLTDDDILTKASFAAWLARQPGWQERDTHEHNVNEVRDGRSMRFWDLIASFGERPPEEICPGANANAVSQWRGLFQHVWSTRITGEGVKVWRCLYCGAESLVTVATS